MGFWKKVILIVTALVVVLGIFIGGLYVGVKLSSNTRVRGLLHQEASVPVVSEVDFGLFWDAWNVIEDHYVNAEKLNRQEMVYGAVSGLLKSLGDPYSVFYPPKENKEFQGDIRGSFEGVGMEIGLRKGILTVIAPLKGTPAERAGILAGDKILKIESTSTLDFTVEEAVRLIRGQKGTAVKLTVLRNGDDDPKTISVTRDTITVPVIDTEIERVTIKEGKAPLIIPSDIFVLRLHNFSENSALRFRDAVRKMALGGQQKLILDLRNNPGGFLESSVQMASFFLSQGMPIVQEDYGHGEVRVHRSYGYNVFHNLPMVILVNQGSASASEILAGALQDYGLAKLVGEKTFGKGSVQEVLSLGDTAIKITVAKWLTPNNRSISEGGLMPDYEIKTKSEDLDAGKDAVMEKAVELLKNAIGRL